MDISVFCERLSARMIPSMYAAQKRDNLDPFSLFLHKGNIVTGRYALAVMPTSAVADPPQVLSLARRGTSRQLFTIPYLHSVGLYLIVVGPIAWWSPLTTTIKADVTGFHSVIVQGIYFVDLETKANGESRSRWGSMSFGNTVKIGQVVDEIVEAK